MNYIPGRIHENFQKEHFFLVNNDFSWSNCGSKRASELWCRRDFDETHVIVLSKGDVVVVRFFKSSPTSEAYSYLERVIYNNGDVIEYKKESIVSLGLIEKNFTDVTKAFERDKKIETILC